MDISSIVSLYVECLEWALPITIVLYFCDFLVTTILRTAFGGKFTFRS